MLCTLGFVELGRQRLAIHLGRSFPLSLIHDRGALPVWLQRMALNSQTIQLLFWVDLALATVWKLEVIGYFLMAPMTMILSLPCICIVSFQFLPFHGSNFLGNWLQARSVDQYFDNWLNGFGWAYLFVMPMQRGTPPWGAVRGLAFRVRSVR